MKHMSGEIQGWHIGESLTAQFYTKPLATPTGIAKG